MRRASYRKSVAWIALNDNPGDNEGFEAIKGYISVALVADMFGVEDTRVALDVRHYRKFQMGMESLAERAS